MSLKQIPSYLILVFLLVCCVQPAQSQEVKSGSTLIERDIQSDIPEPLQLFRDARQYIENDEYEKAKEFLVKSSNNIDNRKFSVASEFLRLVSVTVAKDLFDEATTGYLVSLASENLSEEDREILKRDFEDLKFVVDEEVHKQLIHDLKEDIYKAADRARIIWTELDPTPTIPANQRLIEHHQRLHTARKLYPDMDSKFNMDERGKNFVRFGEPDRVIDRDFNISRGELYSFVTEFQQSNQDKSFNTDTGTTNRLGFNNNGNEDSKQSESVGEQDSDSGMRGNERALTGFQQRASQMIESKYNAAHLVDRLEQSIYSNPFHTNIQIWIYHRFDDEMKDNLVLYFTEQKNGVFKQVRAIDDWIPSSLYQHSSHQTGAKFAPALALQYIIYQRLMHSDRVFMDAFNKLEREIFNNPVERSDASLRRLSSQFRTQHQFNGIQNLAAAPSERSTEKEKVFDIPMDIYQYRKLNEHGEPVFVTFVECKPAVSLLSDLTVNHEKLINGQAGIDEITMAFNQWYKLEQGVELYDEAMNQIGRLRGTPAINIHERSDFPASMVFDIPYLDESVNQVFYSRLENKHDDTRPVNPSIYPEQLRGLSKKSINQPVHFNQSENELMLSDLIVGYNRFDDDDKRYPFIIDHNRVIPEQENLVIHFEVYNLEPGEDGFYNFEIYYEIEEKKQRFRWLRGTPDEFSGTLSFTSSRNRFAESLEFENLQMGEGEYTLSWVIRDTNSGNNLSKSFELIVEETEELITSN